MPLSFRISAVFALLLVQSAAMFWITTALAGERPKWRHYALFCVGFCGIEWGAVGLISLIELFEKEPLLIEILLSAAIALLLCLLLCRCYQTAFEKALGAAMLAYFLAYTINDFMTEVAGYYSPVFDGKYLYVLTSLVLPYSLTLIMVGVIVLILRKSAFSQYFAHLFQGRIRTAFSLSVGFLLMNLKAVLSYFFPDVTADFTYVLFFFGLIAAALFCIQFGSMYAASRDKIKAQEETIAQQQAHMELLEELQNEIRAFRHDFTNLLSGMTLSAQEGDVEAIQEFMKRTSGYFDEKLGKEIRQMEGIANIRIYPIRSLLSTKLSLMRQRHIQVVLEILNPVTGGKMPVEDLLRCQGILLDNAIEAAEKEEGKIRIVLLQEERELYIAIANNYDMQPNLGALGKGGYTTKGKGHGTGLSSYRKMVSRCSGCLTRTYLKDDFLVQELRIPV